MSNLVAVFMLAWPGVANVRYQRAKGLQQELFLLNLTPVADFQRQLFLQLKKGSSSLPNLQTTSAESSNSASARLWPILLSWLLSGAEENPQESIYLQEQAPNWWNMQSLTLELLKEFPSCVSGAWKDEGETRGLQNSAHLSFNKCKNLHKAHSY